jgi:polyisoprenoid-binding protein YceI
MGPEALGAYMAGVLVSGVLWAIFQNNAGGAWDNAKKSFEAGVMIDGEMTYKGSEAHSAAVTGDTVGDPFKDTSGPSMNILIKLTCLVGLVIAPILGGHSNNSDENASMIQSMNQEEGSSFIEYLKSDQNKHIFTFLPEGSSVIWRASKVTGAGHHGTLEIEYCSMSIGEGALSGDIVFNMTKLENSDLDDEKLKSELETHLKSADFLDVIQFPKAKASFYTKEIDENGKWKGIVDVSIHGVESQLEVEGAVRKEGEVFVLESAFTFDRTEFGIVYNSGNFFKDLGDNVINDEVEVEMELSFKEN